MCDPRRFKLVRYQDLSGISGLGVVAHGVEFDNSHVALHWCNQNLSSISIYENMYVMMAIHGHGGATQVEWMDCQPVALST